ncbi:hypothetical protein A1O3_07964 [Capronia epimyces CBS 606.96]|uniref:Alpha/beta hydrolase fold-3 domain-containing protein n=1 Tax=Capronia epimyces CBS 606.96 TaxID=1182542 RepID=W9XHG7_9EURO|nr:uncharacterized protein A1O3_07964 [Capronia epimyces CBS 606.96]EXJ79683.1 hypothetical protein A1O3_07964 [Capronia epimyces CBS 606.96]
MASHSVLTIDSSKFGTAAISEETHAFNQKMVELMANAPRWYEVGATRFREMRAAGETPMPKPVLLDTAESFAIPSRDAGRMIPCRILKPQNGTTAKAIFLHMHGGGWCFQDEKSQDTPLQNIANSTGTMMLSVGYRLAPENPFPAGPNDCYDVAEWLVDNAEAEFGLPLAFVGGESAGAHLSILVPLHLLQHSNPKYADFRFRGLLLHFGCYSLIWTPSVYNFQKPQLLILDRDLMHHFAEAFCPGMSEDQKRHPSVSPLYTDLEALRGKLPPALFTCGTEDCLLDDTVFMSTKWLMAGGEAIVKIVPGAPHGFIFFPRSMKESGSDDGMNAVEDFMRSKLRA